jgi:biotin operon repressor
MGTASEQAPAASRSVELAGAVEVEVKRQERHLELVPLDPLLERVYALATEGASQLEIALAIGKSTTTVTKLESELRTKGYEIRRRRGRPRGSQNGSDSAKQRYTAEQERKAERKKLDRAECLERWIQLYDARVSPEQIAERERDTTGKDVSPNTVWSQLKEAEKKGRVTLRPPGRPCGFEGDRTDLPRLVLESYDGSTLRLAAQLGIAQSFTYNLLHEAGGEVRTPRPRRDPSTKREGTRRAAELYRAPSEPRLADVAAQLPWSVTTVLRDLDEAGVDRRAPAHKWWESDRVRALRAVAAALEARGLSSRATACYGRHAKEFAAAKGTVVGRRAELLTDEKRERIRKLRDAGKSQRATARIVGVSRGLVEHVERSKKVA